MYPRMEPSKVKPVLIALTFMAMLIALAVLMVPATTEAATHTKDVRGYAYDHAYRPIPGASISVTVLNPGNPVTKSEPTDGTGWYNIQFLASEWDEGVTIQVIATYNSVQSDENTTVATNGFVQWLNATAFEFEIPQFGSYFGLLVTAGIIGVVAVTVIFWRRR